MSSKRGTHCQQLWEESRCHFWWVVNTRELQKEFHWHWSHQPCSWIYHPSDGYSPGVLTSLISVVIYSIFLLFSFTNDSRVRCWCENVLTQRARERIQLFLPLPLMPQREKNFLQCHLRTKLPQVDILPFYFLCFSLSIFLTYSHCLWVLFFLVAYSFSWPVFDFN